MENRIRFQVIAKEWSMHHGPLAHMAWSNEDSRSSTGSFQHICTYHPPTHIRIDLYASLHADGQSPSVLLFPASRCAVYPHSHTPQLFLTPHPISPKLHIPAPASRYRSTTAPNPITAFAPCNPTHSLGSGNRSERETRETTPNPACWYR